MLRGELERDAATHRITEYVDLVVAELLEHAGHVVAHVHQAEFTIAQRRGAAAPPVDPRPPAGSARAWLGWRRTSRSGPGRHEGATAAHPCHTRRSSS